MLHFATICDTRYTLRDGSTCHSRTRHQDGRRPLKCTNPVDFHLVPKVKISLTRQGGILHFLSDFFPAELDKFVFLGHPKNSQFTTPFIFNFSSILPSSINPSPLFLHHLLSNSSLISPFCSSSASLWYFWHFTSISPPCLLDNN